MIPLLDLKQQYQSIRHEVEPAVLKVLASTEYVLGAEVQGFEEELAEYCGCSQAVAVNSGTAALELALRALGVGPGDEVITVPFTFVATVAAIENVGARPVLVDIDPETYTMDPDQVVQAITPRTRGVMPVHLYGQVADMDPLIALADSRGLEVIEDAAQAHGADYRGRQAGSLGAMGCFSFYPAKNLGACGEGGAITTNDPRLAQRLRMLRDWGQSRKYLHELKGGNYRMDAVQGAILRIKLRHLEAWTRARRERAARYDELLERAEVVRPKALGHNRHVYHLYCIQCEERDQLSAELEKRGIRTGIHYPTPVHLQPAYRNLGYDEGAFPVAEFVARRVLSLPLFPELALESVDFICQTIRSLRPKDVDQ